MNSLSLVFLGLGLASLWMSGLWLWQRFVTKNAAWVDLGWTLSVPLLHGLLALGAGGCLWRNLGLAGLTGLWGARLGGHLYRTRLLKGMPEEGRYLQLRQEWGNQFQLKLFWFYQAQALAAWLLVVVFLPVYQDPRCRLGGPEFWGWLLFWVGWAGVSLADAQLHRFKQSPQGQAHGVCQVGLWNYSRHPNYFFESVLWTGWATYGLASPWGWLALVAPAIILKLVLSVTGIPPTEAQALRSKGEAYRRYQASTSAFIPWFKRKDP